MTKDVIYLSAMEKRFRVAQANIGIDTSGKLTDELINCRINGDFELVPPDMVDLLDVSPKQIVSVAAALIPFLENDDANRALMGSNMQRKPCRCCKQKRRWSAQAWKKWSPATVVLPFQRAAPAWLTKSMRRVSLFAPRKKPMRRNPVLIFTICVNSNAPTINLHQSASAGACWRPC